MRTILYIIMIGIMLSIYGCKTIQYVPIEKTKTEYVTQHDSIYMYDSIYYYRYDKGDTVYITDYKYRYKDRWHTDTLIVRDSIPFPVEVEKVVVVNELTILQKIMIWIGVFSMIGVFMFVVKKIYK